jgi:hypothetical protein
MNRVERVLHEEITHLLDRLATSVPEGSLDHVRTASPDLNARLQGAEADLAATRQMVLEGYGRWRRALEEMENLWAVAGARSAAAEEPLEEGAALAA